MHRHQFLWRATFVLTTLAELSLGVLFLPENLSNGVYEFNWKSRYPKNEDYVDHPQWTTHYDIDPNVNITAMERDSGNTDHAQTPLMCEDPSRNASYADWDIAQAMLGNWCEQYDPKVAGAVVSVWGDSVWYVCNGQWIHGWHTQHCSRDEIAMIAAETTIQCELAKGCINRFECHSTDVCKNGGKCAMNWWSVKWEKGYGRSTLGRYICEDRAI